MAPRQVEDTPEGRADTVKLLVSPKPPDPGTGRYGHKPFDAATRRRRDAEMLRKTFGRGDAGRGRRGEKNLNFLRVPESPSLRVRRFQLGSPCPRVSVSCLRTDQGSVVK